MKPKVFISSHEDEFRDLKEIAKIELEEMGCEVLVWKNIVPSDNRAKENYLKHVEECDFFVIIVGKEYSSASYEELKKALSSRKKILSFVDGRVRHKADEKAQKIIEEKLRKEKSYTTFNSMEEFRKRIKASIVEELFEKYKKTPFLLHSKKELYDLGSSLAEQAENRVVLLARSLILITGPRNYEYERRHYEVLLKLTEKASNGKIEFKCGCIPDITKKELERLSDHYRTKDNIAYLFECMKHENSKFLLRFPSPTWGTHLAFMVADDKFAVWFTDPYGEGQYITITAKDRTVADVLYNIFDEQCVDKSIEEVYDILNIIR